MHSDAESAQQPLADDCGVAPLAFAFSVPDEAGALSRWTVTLSPSDAQPPGDVKVAETLLAQLKTAVEHQLTAPPPAVSATPVVDNQPVSLPIPTAKSLLTVTTAAAVVFGVDAPRVWNGLPLDATLPLHSLYRPQKTHLKTPCSDSHKHLASNL